MGQSEPKGCLSLLFGPFGSTQTRKPGDTKVYYVDDQPRNPIWSAEEFLPYKLQRYFLSRTEMSFYHVLVNVIDGHAAICPKVNLKDVFYVPSSKDYHAPSYWNRINQKHVDFLLCDPKTMQPIAGVELDDSSHQRADRIRRDEFVDSVFEAAGLPLVHIPAQRSYNTRELQSQFMAVLPKLATTSEIPPKLQAEPVPLIPGLPPAEPETPSKPLCPVCGIPMQIRARTDKAANAALYHVCPNYKVCKQYRPANGSTPA